MKLFAAPKFFIKKRGGKWHKYMVKAQPYRFYIWYNAKTSDQISIGSKSPIPDIVKNKVVEMFKNKIVNPLVPTRK